jgi:hypothetical protein
MLIKMTQINLFSEVNDSREQRRHGLGFALSLSTASRETFRKQLNRLDFSSRRAFILDVKVITLRFQFQHTICILISELRFAFKKVSATHSERGKLEQNLFLPRDLKITGNERKSTGMG